jgi:hypothetical protein
MQANACKKASYDSFFLKKAKPTLAKRQAMIHFHLQNVSQHLQKGKL